VLYEFKIPYSDSTTHVVLSPLDFMVKLSALVPSPIANQPSCWQPHGYDILQALRGEPSIT
jgi:hypothetical protein